MQNTRKSKDMNFIPKPKDKDKVKKEFTTSKKEFDRDKKNAKRKELSKSKKIGKPVEFDKAKKLDKNNRFEKTAELNESKKFERQTENDYKPVEAEVKKPVKKEKYILNKNKELIRDRNTIINATIKDEPLEFETAEVLFSPTAIDKGTLNMLSVVEFGDGDKVLDLGCGYGPVGLYAARKVGPSNVVMVDKSAVAVKLSARNAIKNKLEGIKIVQSDAYDAIDDTNFTYILSNPPYHTDFTVAKKFIEKGFNRLALEGRMVMVTKRKEWYKNRFIAIFGGVKIWEIEDYFVFMAIKKSMSYAPKKK